MRAATSWMRTQRATVSSPNASPSAGSGRVRARQLAGKGELAGQCADGPFLRPAASLQVSDSQVDLCLRPVGGVKVDGVAVEVGKDAADHRAPSATDRLGDLSDPAGRAVDGHLFTLVAAIAPGTVFRPRAKAPGIPEVDRQDRPRRVERVIARRPVLTGRNAVRSDRLSPIKPATGVSSSRAIHNLVASVAATSIPALAITNSESTPAPAGQGHTLLARPHATPGPGTSVGMATVILPCRRGSRRGCSATYVFPSQPRSVDRGLARRVSWRSRPVEERTCSDRGNVVRRGRLPLVDASRSRIARSARVAAGMATVVSSGERNLAISTSLKPTIERSSGIDKFRRRQAR